MQTPVTFRRLLFVLPAAALAACATAGGAPDMRWAAHGYLTPGGDSDPEIIGDYDSQAECRAAVDYWMSRQVVGNPVSGECLPLDTH